MVQLAQIPLVFSFEQLVQGKGFIAGVRMDGRALLENEQTGDEDEVWVTGIVPVGIAGGGVDRSVAFVEFRNAWIETVFDIAYKAASFEEFRQSCQEFLGAEQASMTALWEEAVATVRREQYVDPSLRRENADRHSVAFEIVDLTHSQFDSAENKVEKGLQVAA